MKTWPAVVLAALFTAMAAQVPRASEERPDIRGRVLDAETRQVVRRANVKIFTPKDQWYDLTDGQGRFRFSGLPPGEYTLVAHRDGFSDRTYTLERSDFADHKEFLIELHRQGVIAGRVVDRWGQPLQGASVEALKTRAGGADLVARTETNDLGDYRLSWLDPGTYQVRARYREGGTSEFDSLPVTIATSYYGGSDKPAPVAVKIGAELSGVNFVLETARPITIRGVIRTEDHVLTDRARLWILGHAGEAAQSEPAENGRFEINDIGAGSYTIYAQTSDRYGSVTVDVRDKDLDNIEIVLRAMPRLDAEVRVEGQVRTDASLGPVYFVRTNPNMGIGVDMRKPDQNGKFTVRLVPGEYLVRPDESIRKLGIRGITLDDQPIVDWKIKVDAAEKPKKLIIVVGSKAQP